MAQGYLDVALIGTALQAVCGKGVPEGMRRYVLGNAGFKGAVLYDMGYTFGAVHATALTFKDIFFGGVLLDVFVQQGNCLVAQDGVPVLFAFCLTYQKEISIPFQIGKLEFQKL